MKPPASDAAVEPLRVAQRLAEERSAEEWSPYKLAKAQWGAEVVVFLSLRQACMERSTLFQQKEALILYHPIAVRATAHGVCLLLWFCAAREGADGIVGWSVWRNA